MRSPRVPMGLPEVLRRRLGYLAVFVVATTLAAPATAQIDSDPTNNTAAGGDILNLAVGAAVSNVADLAGFGDDVDFFNVTLASGNVLIGMTTPIDEPSTLEYPDTMVSVMLGGAQFTFSDDDFADSNAASRGSLFRFRASGAGTYNIGVTGFVDYEFDGPASGDSHVEFGRYALVVGRINPAILGGGFADTDPSNDFLAGADLVTIGASGAVVTVAEMLSGDIDYYKLQLSAGDVLSALTAPLFDLPSSFDFPDTLLSLYDSSGVQLLENDDAGDVGSSDANPDLASDNPYFAEPVFGSALRAIIPADGIYYLRVEQSPFQDPGTQVGRYGMLIGVVAAALPPSSDGDFNEDGLVDAADYVVWRKFYGAPFDDLDYEDWVANFGESTEEGGGASAGNVPEPASILLLVTIALLASAARPNLPAPSSPAAASPESGESSDAGLITR